MKINQVGLGLSKLQINMGADTEFFMSVFRKFNARVSIMATFGELIKFGRGQNLVYEGFCHN